MKLVEFVPPTPHPLWELCPQMGITDVVVKVNPDLTGMPDPWRYETLAAIVGRLESAGLNVVGLEGDPFDMRPIKEFGVDIRNGQDARCPSREEALAHYRELLESMGKLGIKLLCYNFMVGKGWSRTGVREGRGGAKATFFSLDEFLTGFTRFTGLKEIGAMPTEPDNPVNPVNPVQEKLLLSHELVWANYEHFIKAVMPTAEKFGIRMGLHPDDPCLDSLGGYARIFGSVEAYDRAYALYPSPSNAVTFCQANFKLMGVDLEKTARHFGKRIAFIHIRDVEGNKTDFTELFHDQGDTDQFALMRTYREIGLDVPVRGDHVPEMAYDRILTRDGTPGYFTLGRLFANGYLKALLQGTEDAAQTWID
ncbi:MAG: mannonate dehydratase [Kiritimatiellae bacterium]|nr:mannonate dehydratase [Kiritimatiellia bacterium]